MHELLPKATVIGFLVNPTFTDAEAEISDANEAAVSNSVLPLQP